MKISGISLYKYGKFIDKLTLKFSRNRPNVVFGKNEAGKTTLVSAIGELLFGFSKSRKDRHPYLPWNEDLIRIEMDYLNRENREFIINRLLSTNAKATLIDGLAQKPMGNVPVPEADFITHNIFRNVYMITSDQLKEIESQTLGELQDKLVLNYGNSNVSPKQVAAQMDEEIKLLYNSRSRSNKQIINELLADVKTLKHERKEKRELHHQMRVMRDDIEKLEEELKELDRMILEKVGLKQRIMRYLNPIRLLDRIDNLKSNVPRYDQLQHLERDILDRYRELSDQHGEIKRQIEEKQNRIASRKARIEELNEDERLALGYQEQIDEIEQLQETIRNDISEMDRVEERLKVGLKKVANEVGYLFEGLVSEIPGFDIKEIQTLYFKSKEEGTGQKGGALAVIRLLVVMALLAVGVYIRNTYGLIVLGITLLIVLFDVLDRRAKSRKPSEAQLQKRLAELGVKQELVEHFSDINLHNLENFCEIRQHNIELLQTLQLKEEKLATLEAEMEGIFEPFHEVKTLRHLRQVLSAAQTRTSLNAEIHEGIRVDTEEFAALDQRRMEIENALNLITRKIEKAGEGSLDNGLAVIEAFLPIQDRILHHEAELAESFNLASLREEVAEMDTSVINEDYLVVVEHEIEEMQQRHEEKSKYSVQLKAEIDHKIQGDTLDMIEGQIVVKENEIAERSKEYDLLCVLREAVRRGEERYREKNQPDVLRLAGEYFSTMTGGRYSDILLEEGSQIFIRSHDGELISADNELSAGTKNQLYLSLRLAFITYLDRDREKLPILLDEVFSNWDAERLEPTMRLIDRIAEDRQVILFTCREDNLRHYEQHLTQVQKIIL